MQSRVEFRVASQVIGGCAANDSTTCIGSEAGRRVLRCSGEMPRDAQNLPTMTMLRFPSIVSRCVGLRTRPFCRSDLDGCHVQRAR